MQFLTPTSATLMDPRSFKISVALRLCHIHKCVCGNVVDSYGHHALSCVKSKGRLSRHSSLNNILKRALTSSDIPSILEPAGISRSDGKRPDGLTLVPWREGKSLIWDSTCVDTVALLICLPPLRSQDLLQKVPHATSLTNTHILPTNFIFVPFAVETLGPWCREAKYPQL